MKDEARYRRICNILGFEPKNIGKHITIPKTEDDRFVNPYEKISGEDIFFLYDNGYLNPT